MLRLAMPSDALRISEIFAPYVKTAITFSTVAPTSADFERRISETLPDYPFLVWEERGQVVAYAYASKHRTLAAYRWCAEVSIYVDQAGQQRGSGSALYTALLELLRLQGIVNLYAGITLPNPASVRVHEKFGFHAFSLFENVGYKAGAWRNVGWWEKRFIENQTTPPKEPISFAQLREKEAAKVGLILGSAI